MSLSQSTPAQSNPLKIKNGNQQPKLTTTLPSAGLEPTGGPSSMCSSSTGQVYARAGSYNGAFAIMYSWYMPKDSPSTGLGHRHDWENAVVWLSAQSTTAKVIGAAASAHGDFDTTTTPNQYRQDPTSNALSWQTRRR